MSGESLAHIRLVEALERHVRSTYHAPRGLLLLVDHHAYGTNRPGRIGAYSPDLLACDLPTTFEIIGEAKTPHDVETQRSALQIGAFLDYLSFRPGSTFCLCVNRYSMGRAKALLSRIIRPEHAAIGIEVIAGD